MGEADLLHVELAARVVGVGEIRVVRAGDQSDQGDRQHGDDERRRRVHHPPPHARPLPSQLDDRHTVHAATASVPATSRAGIESPATGNPSSGTRRCP